MKAWCSYCGEDIEVRNGKLVPHEDVYPVRACEGGNRSFERRTSVATARERLLSD